MRDCISKKFNFNRNDVYLNELKYFFNCIKKKKFVDYPFSVESSIKTLECSINLKKGKILSSLFFITFL